MRELIDDLLLLSQVGRDALKVETVDMAGLIEIVLGDLRAAEAGIEIELGELPVARGDASLLRQVWTNLLSNAVKFSSRVERPRIEIGGSNGEGRVEYFVRDNGAGFDMRYAQRLFKLFQRLHDAGEFEGTGAGLAIVQRIVQRHGGTVSAQGRPGGGATFGFSLPA